MLTPIADPDSLRLDDATLPDRVRALLQDALDVAQQRLTPLLRESLLDFYQGQLHGIRMPDAAVDAADALPPKLRQQHAQTVQSIEPAFLRLLESGLARLRQPLPASAAEPALPRGPLQLVSLDALDADTLIRDTAVRLATRAASPLHQLGMRMGVLAAAPPLDAACNPLGPHRILSCCRQACDIAHLEDAQIIALLQSMEKRLLPTCAELVDSVNAALLEGGLLVHLGVAHYRASSLPAWPAAPAASVAADTDRIDARAARSQAMPARARVDAALARLQQRDGSTPLSSAEIRRALTDHAVDAGTGIGLDAEAHAAFGMMDALFAALDDTDLPAGTHAALLHGLQIPLLRAAVDDPRLAQQAQHPAQQLLATLLQARHEWHDPVDSDPSATIAIRDAVTQVRDGYQGDAQVFERADAELKQRLHTLSRRAQLAERRHVEAARGQERLAIARLHVEELLNEMTADLLLPPLFRALLEQSWQDVLVLTRLRHAPESPRWLEQMDLTRRLIDRQRHPQAEDDAELRSVVELALSDIGYSEPDAASIALQLAPLPGHAPDPDEQELIARHLSARPHIQPAAMVKRDAPAAVQPERNAEEQGWHERLRQLPFGVWLEWQDDDSRQWLRRRLAWFGTVTDRALIVNAHGHKAIDTTLDHIARRLAAGTVRLADSDSSAPRLLERAWNAAKRRLGLAGAPVPPAVSPSDLQS